MLFSLLLAGGKSSRMGEDKSRLVFEGQTLLECTYSLLESLDANHVLVSGKVDGYQCIEDLVPQAGPPGGLYSAVEYINEQYGLKDSLLLVVPVDMPLLNAEILKHLIEQAKGKEACQFEDEVFPCIFRLTSELKQHLAEIFAESAEKGDKRSMKALLQKFNAHKVSKEGFADKFFMNVNTPEDWEKII